MESILDLFARMIPFTNGSSSGRSERSSFIRSVFVQSSPDRAGLGEQLVKMLERVPTSDWEQAASNIVAIIAKSDIAL